jgi:hypothetical protein
VVRTLPAPHGQLSVALLQDFPPTLASLVGALSFNGKTPLQQAAKAAFHPEEWPKMPPPTSSKAKPAWLPGVDARDALPEQTLREIAVPLEPRYLFKQPHRLHLFPHLFLRVVRQSLLLNAINPLLPATIQACIDP